MKIEPRWTSRWAPELGVRGERAAGHGSTAGSSATVRAGSTARVHGHRRSRPGPRPPRDGDGGLFADAPKDQSHFEVYTADGERLVALEYRGPNEPVKETWTLRDLDGKVLTQYTMEGTNGRHR